FMYYEDTDLCWRLLQAGWAVELCPDARFAHVGGASTSQAPSAMYREQLRSHLRFIATHRGALNARVARVLLVWTLRVKGVVLPGPRRDTLGSTARWLASASGDAHLAYDRRETRG